MDNLNDPVSKNDTGNLNAKDDDNEMEFQIRPPMEKRFSKDHAKEILHTILNEELSNKHYEADKMADLSKSLAVTLQTRFKAVANLDYKVVVHIIMGEQRGAGIRTVARCLWDPANDAIVTEIYENESLFCVATVFAAYFY